MEPLDGMTGLWPIANFFKNPCFRYVADDVYAINETGPSVDLLILVLLGLCRGYTNILKV